MKNVAIASALLMLLTTACASETTEDNQDPRGVQEESPSPPPAEFKVDDEHTKPLTDTECYLNCMYAGPGGNTAGTARAMHPFCKMACA